MTSLWNDRSPEHFQRWGEAFEINFKEGGRKKYWGKGTDISEVIKDLKEACCLKWLEHRVSGDESGYMERLSPDCTSPWLRGYGFGNYPNDNGSQ